MHNLYVHVVWTIWSAGCYYYLSWSN